MTVVCLDSAWSLHADAAAVPLLLRGLETDAGVRVMNAPIGFVTAVTPCSLTSVFKLYSALKIRFSRWIYRKPVVGLRIAAVWGKRGWWWSSGVCISNASSR